MSELSVQDTINDTQTADPAPQKASIMDVLRLRDFRLLWSGQGISLLGDQFYLIALPLLALSLSDGSGFAVGVALMMAGIPRAIFILIGGAISDRFSPRSIMIWSNALQALVVSVLTILIVMDGLLLWHLYVASFLFGLVDAFFFPAQSAILPMLVHEDQLESGNALMQITLRAALFVGPAIAGAVIAAWGTGAALTLDVATFLVAILALSMIRGGKRKQIPKPKNEDIEAGMVEAQPGLLQSIREGLAYVLRDPILRTAMLMIAIIDFAVVGPVAVGLPVLAERQYDGAASFGLMMAGFGAGSLVGILVGGMVKFKRRGYLFMALMLIFSLTFLLMPYAPGLWFVALLMAAAGMGSGIFNVVGVSLLQRRTDNAMMGRVMSLIMLSSVGLQPVSNAIAGALADVNMRLMMTAAGVFILAGTAFLSFNREMRELR